MAKSVMVATNIPLFFKCLIESQSLFYRNLVKKMIDVLYLQINIIGMMILSIILMNQQNVDDGTGRQKAFVYLIYSVFAILILDSGMWLIDGKQLPYFSVLNWIVSSMYYFFNCFIGFVWFIYMSILFYDKKIKDKKFWRIISIPVILNSIFIFLNIKYKFYFYINEFNIYTRGSLFFLAFFIVLPYFMIPLYYCLRVYRMSENILERKNCAIIIKIYVLPIIGVVIQNLFYGLSLIWICVVLSLLLIFINFQNKRISTDPLTQLNNRCQFDVYLQNIQRGMTKGEQYSIIFIDLDKFKKINDDYGHVYGDRVLIAVARILRQACEEKGAIIGRYGGDEFYVFCKTEIKDEIIKRINRYLDEYNGTNNEGIVVSLSIGTSDFHGEEFQEMEGFVELADKAMYRNKIK